MTDRGRPPAAGGRRWVWVGVALLALAVLPAVTVSRLEERDGFCIACHTVPEIVYFDRAQAALAGMTPMDLSSAHYAAMEPGVRCIDCHRGDGGPAHRAAVLALGARDTLIFLSGRADPTIEKASVDMPALLTASCVECHVDTLLVTGFENHYHNKLPQAYRAWQTGGALTAPEEGSAASALAHYDTDVRCTDCHRAHVHVDGAELQGYLDLVGSVYPACEQCHRDTGHGPVELQGD